MDCFFRNIGKRSREIKGVRRKKKNKRSIALLFFYLLLHQYIYITISTSVSISLSLYLFIKNVTSLFLLISQRSTSPFQNGNFLSLNHYYLLSFYWNLNLTFPPHPLVNHPPFPLWLILYHLNTPSPPPSPPSFSFSLKYLFSSPPNLLETANYFWKEKFSIS